MTPLARLLTHLKYVSLFLILLNFIFYPFFPPKTSPEEDEQINERTYFTAVVVNFGKLSFYLCKTLCLFYNRLVVPNLVLETWAVYIPI